MALYRKKGSGVEACSWTGSIESWNWISGFVSPASPSMSMLPGEYDPTTGFGPLLVEVQGGEIRVNIGDWLVRDSEGKFACWPEDHFLSIYEYVR